MNNKDTYTKTFLSAADIDPTDQLIDSKRAEWWYNVRQKDGGGLRLTEQGIDFVQNQSKLKTDD